jgi:hypothetical protein
MVVLSAVWEHLLPSERPEVLKQIWSLLRPGGFFFLNQTPHRFTPVETHTTGLPLINYLPDRLALSFARKFSKRVDRHETWDALLRKGIRRGTENEVAGIITNRFNNISKTLRPKETAQSQPRKKGFFSPSRVWDSKKSRRRTNRQEPRRISFGFINSAQRPKTLYQSLATLRFVISTKLCRRNCYH